VAVPGVEEPLPARRRETRESRRGATGVGLERFPAGRARDLAKFLVWLSKGEAPKTE
jgi:hypothetical protein